MKITSLPNFFGSPTYAVRDANGRFMSPPEALVKVAVTRNTDGIGASGVLFLVGCTVMAIAKALRK